MLKKITYLITIVGLLLVGFFLLSIAPYHVYTLTITEGINTSFLKMKPSNVVLYDSLPKKYSGDDQKSFDDSNLFSEMHFSNFVMPLPLNHPTFNIIPIIKLDRMGAKLGMTFNDTKSNEFVSFMQERPFKLKTSHGDQKLFTLPIFKNYMIRKSEEELWKDLFSKNLSLPSSEGKSFFESLNTLKKVSYYELVYNLFILYNRVLFFPENIKGFSYDEATKHGIVELISVNPKFRTEQIMHNENGVVYTISISTKINNLIAERLSKKIFKFSKYKSSSTDSAISIYAQYKNISYGKRIDQNGMGYLYSAWSHDLENRDYVRVIILFLERGKSNLKYLKPFYEYAYKKFGSNFSNEAESIVETADERLKRKMTEELEGEVRKEGQALKPKFEGEFSTPEEKVKYMLQKAKDKKNNTDDKIQSLSIE